MLLLFLSNLGLGYGTAPVGGGQQFPIIDMIVYQLPSITGKVRWIDYLPVQIVVPATNKQNRYDDDGCLVVRPLASIAGLTSWIDYIPVYPENTDQWRYDDDGYLRIDTLTPF